MSAIHQTRFVGERPGSTARFASWAGRAAALLSACLALLLGDSTPAADHNDPNAVNSIFWDIKPDPADLYDMFGFPTASARGKERVALALTFAPFPAPGTLDPDLLYRVMVYPGPRVARASGSGSELKVLLSYASTIKEKYAHGAPAEIRVRRHDAGNARLDFIGFPGGNFSYTAKFDRVVNIDTPRGRIQAFVGGRDDAFFNDLPGFFRSISYAPQFYQVPHSMTNMREMPIPKTLIELEGNAAFNFDPVKPDHGQGMKEKLPAGGIKWTGNRFSKDADGDYRFVYSGRDAQAGYNVNAIVVEMPLAFITASPQSDRIVNAWGESWVLKAADRVELIPDDSRSWYQRMWGWMRSWFQDSFTSQLDAYKRVDTDGVPFADAGLNERLDRKQLGADNELLARDLVTRLGHLGWGFGPSISALELGTCFDHDDAPVSKHETYVLATAAFPRVKKCLFQEVNMPDDSWNPKHLAIPLKRPFEIFIPNVCAVDMDTTGTWPYGRRLEDQVANRFLAIFLDMRAGCGGKCNVDTLSSQTLWDGVRIKPKTSPNPLNNDVKFLSRFPYLAPPHTKPPY